MHRTSPYQDEMLKNSAKVIKNIPTTNIVDTKLIFFAPYLGFYEVFILFYAVSGIVVFVCTVAIVSFLTHLAPMPVMRF